MPNKYHSHPFVHVTNMLLSLQIQRTLVYLRYLSSQCPHTKGGNAIIHNIQMGIERLSNLPKVTQEAEQGTEPGL